jgi:hypothetical protein
VTSVLSYEYDLFGGNYIWVYGYIGIWVHGYMGVWVYGYMGIWVYGYMGIWVSSMATWVGSQGRQRSHTIIAPRVYRYSQLLWNPKP